MKIINTKILDDISGLFFFLGFLTSKSRFLPFVFLAMALNTFCITAYLIGYLTWSLTAFLYPNYPRHKRRWYGFAQFNDQYKMAAFLGTLATIICIIDPAALVLTSWLYVVSNLIWTVSEYHKKYNPSPYDVGYSEKKQAIYLKYSILVTTSSIITAVAATMVMLFPFTALWMVSAGAFLGGTFTLAAIYHWSRFFFYSPLIKQSYTMLNKALPYRLHRNQEIEFNVADSNHHASPISKSAQKNTTEDKASTEYIKNDEIQGEQAAIAANHVFHKSRSFEFASFNTFY